MPSIESFGLAVLVASAVGIAAVLSSRLSERLRIPAPAFFLIGAAVASDIWPNLSGVSFGALQDTVTIALAVILFDGGMRTGWRRFRSAAVATTWIGVAGTVATAIAVAVAAHALFSFGWHAALLIGTALAPTDPAVVFSVLGRRELAGRGGVLLEGESGANDPVGIALLVALLTVQTAGPAAVGVVAWSFLLEMVVGALAGVLGGRALLVFMRRVPLPDEGMYTLRVLAGALAIYGLATVAHGSGFLAVYVAGIMIGDEHAPYKGEIAHFHSSLASLAEVVAFVMLGLTIRLRDLPLGAAWLIGLALAALLAFVIRPVLVGLLLWPVRLRARERVFVLWSGLKGAVPILLGAFIVQAGVRDAARIYEIIFAVVAFSVIVQGSTIPALANWLKLPLRTVEPEPWSLSIRFQEEPENLFRFTVVDDAGADGARVGDLTLPASAWVSFIVRDGQLQAARAGTLIRAGDEVVVLAEQADEGDLRALFRRRRESGGPGGTGTS